MTTRLAYRRLLDEAPARLATSLFLLLLAGFIYQYLEALQERPAVLAVVLLVCFAAAVGAYRLYRASTPSAKTSDPSVERTPSTPVSRDIDALASSEHRFDTIVEFWRSLAPSAAEEAASLQKEWVELTRDYEREIGRLRSSVAKHASRRYLVVVEDVLQSGALLEEVIEELGIPVRRVISAESERRHRQYVIFVNPDLPHKQEIISFADMADEPERFRTAFSSTLLHRRQTVSPEFIQTFGSLISRLAHASLVLSQARRRA